MLLVDEISKKAIDATIKSAKNKIKQMKQLSDSFTLNMFNQYNYIQSNINLMKSNFSQLAYTKSFLEQLISRGGDVTGGVFQVVNRNFAYKRSQYDESIAVGVNSYFDLNGDFYSNAYNMDTSKSTWTDSPNFQWDTMLIPQNEALERINNGEHQYAYSPISNRILNNVSYRGYAVFNAGYLEHGDEWRHIRYTLDLGDAYNAYSKEISESQYRALLAKGWTSYYLDSNDNRWNLVYGEIRD